MGTNNEIFVYEFKTDSVIQLTKTDYGVSNTNPSWSPSGNKIVFTSNRAYADADTQRFRKDLYVINTDGTNLKRLSYTGNTTKPIWGPDGNQITYEWNIDGNEVFLYDINAVQITQLETGLKYAGNPLWNKQGNKLLIFGTQQNYSKHQMRLIMFVNDSSEVLQVVRLDKKEIGRNYDWHIYKKIENQRICFIKA